MIIVLAEFHNSLVEDNIALVPSHIHHQCSEGKKRKVLKLKTKCNQKPV